MTLRRKVISSLSWLAGARFTAQLIAWVITIWVIRILSPNDYGLMALAMIVIGLLALVNEMGMGSSIVQRPQLEPELIECVFGLLILLNAILYLFLFLAAPMIATFFDEPSLEIIIRVASLQLPLLSLAAIPNSILRRRMDFRRKSLVELTATIMASVCTLWLALHHYRVWSLVFGQLVYAAVSAVGMSAAARYWCWPRFSFSGMHEVLRFGGFVTVSQILWYLYTRTDAFLIGKLLGKDILGFYSVAMHLATLPMQKISGMLNEVGFSAFSTVQNDRHSVSSHFSKTVRMLSLFSFPVFFGISSVAPEIVGVFLGEKWRLSTLPIQILSLIVPFRMLANVTTPALMGIGRPDIAAGNVLIACLIMPTAFFIGVNWGLIGVSLAWLFAYPLQFLIMLKRSLPVLHMRIPDYLTAIRGAALASTLMYLAVALVRGGTTYFMLPAALELTILVLSGVLTYTSLIWFIQRDAYHEASGLIRG